MNAVVTAAPMAAGTTNPMKMPSEPIQANLLCECRSEEM